MQTKTELGSGESLCGLPHMKKKANIESRQAARKQFCKLPPPALESNA